MNFNIPGFNRPNSTKTETKERYILKTKYQNENDYSYKLNLDKLPSLLINDIQHFVVGNDLEQLTLAELDENLMRCIHNNTSESEDNWQLMLKKLEHIYVAHNKNKKQLFLEFYTELKRLSGEVGNVVDREDGLRLRKSIREAYISKIKILIEKFESGETNQEFEKILSIPLVDTVE